MPDTGNTNQAAGGMSADELRAALEGLVAANPTPENAAVADAQGRVAAASAVEKTSLLDSLLSNRGIAGLARTALAASAGGAGVGAIVATQELSDASARRDQANAMRTAAINEAHSDYVAALGESYKQNLDFFSSNPEAIEWVRPEEFERLTGRSGSVVLAFRDKAAWNKRIDESDLLLARMEEEGEGLSVAEKADMLRTVWDLRGLPVPDDPAFFETLSQEGVSTETFTGRLHGCTNESQRAAWEAYDAVVASGGSEAEAALAGLKLLRSRYTEAQYASAKWREELDAKSDALHRFFIFRGAGNFANAEEALLAYQNSESEAAAELTTLFGGEIPISVMQDMYERLDITAVEADSRQWVRDRNIAIEEYNSMRADDADFVPTPRIDENEFVASAVQSAMGQYLNLTANVQSALEADRIVQYKSVLAQGMYPNGVPAEIPPELEGALTTAATELGIMKRSMWHDMTPGEQARWGSADTYMMAIPEGFSLTDILDMSAREMRAFEEAALAEYEAATLPASASESERLVERRKEVALGTAGVEEFGTYLVESTKAMSPQDAQAVMAGEVASRYGIGRGTARRLVRDNAANTGMRTDDVIRTAEAVDIAIMEGIASGDIRLPRIDGVDYAEMKESLVSRGAEIDPELGDALRQKFEEDERKTRMALDRVRHGFPKN